MGDWETDDLRDNIAGQAVMIEAVRVASASPPSPAARLLGRSPIPRQARSWLTGTSGEIEVGALLARLGPGWTVLHAVPVGERGSDIDHVVVGPAGVFTLNTKHHPGATVWVSAVQVRVAGHVQPYLRNSRHESRRASRLLGVAVGGPVPVRGVVVLVGIGTLTDRGRPEDVVVLRSGELLGWLARQAPVLDPWQVTALADAAARPQTWTHLPQLPVDRGWLLTEYRRLRSAERRALLVRSGWLAAATATALASVVVRWF